MNTLTIANNFFSQVLYIQKSHEHVNMHIYNLQKTRTHKQHPLFCKRYEQKKSKCENKLPPPPEGNLTPYNSNNLQAYYLTNSLSVTRQEV